MRNEKIDPAALFSQQAESDDSHGQFHLGKLYEAGIGTAPLGDFADLRITNMCRANMLSESVWKQDKMFKKANREHFRILVLLSSEIIPGNVGRLAVLCLRGRLRNKAFSLGLAGVYVMVWELKRLNRGRLAISKCLPISMIELVNMNSESVS
jgi:hypothetical protein